MRCRGKKSNGRDGLCGNNLIRRNRRGQILKVKVGQVIRCPSCNFKNIVTPLDKARLLAKKNWREGKPLDQYQLSILGFPNRESVPARI